MISTCIFCHQPLPLNQALESFQYGTRIAYDPARGRLWAVCPHCSRWNLAPFEARWEVLEQLECLVRADAHMLVQGENIALVSAGPLELVRVGKADLREEAWWRYGRELTRRKQAAESIAQRGKIIDTLVWLLIVGIPIWGMSDAQSWLDGARRKRFGREAWRGALACEGCGEPVAELLFADWKAVRLAGSAGAPALRIPCERCRQRGGATLSGPLAVDTLRRLLAYHNFSGANRSDLDYAAAMIADAGSPLSVIDTAAQRQLVLGGLNPIVALSLEIALNDEVERMQLQSQVRNIEVEWRAAENIAAIADGELTPLRLPVRE